MATDELTALRAEVVAQQERLDSLKGEWSAFHAERDALREELAALKANYEDAVTAENKELVAELATQRMAWEDAISRVAIANTELERELAEVKRERDALREERDKALADFKEMTGGRDHAVMQRERYWKQTETLRRELAEARAEIARLKAQMQAWLEIHGTLVAPPAETTP